MWVWQSGGAWRQVCAPCVLVPVTEVPVRGGVCSGTVLSGRVFRVMCCAGQWLFVPSVNYVKETIVWWS